jgi:hypothetical protein
MFSGRAGLRARPALLIVWPFGRRVLGTSTSAVCSEKRYGIEENVRDETT